MNRETVGNYRHERNEVLRLTARGDEVPAYRLASMREAAMKIAEEVLIDLAVRAERRRIRRRGAAT